MRVPAHRLVAAAVAIGVAFTAGIFTGSSSSSGRPPSPTSPSSSGAARTVVPAGPEQSSTPPAAPPAVPFSPLPPGRTTLAPPPAPPGTSGTHSGPTTGPAAERSPVTTSQTADMDDVLRQGDTRPDDIAAQLTVFLSGGFGCASGYDVTPPTIEVPEYARIPSLLSFCVGGLDQGRELTYTVTDPGGTARTRTLPPGWDPMDDLNHLLLPGAPTGRYRISVVQDGTRLAGEFQARRSTKATLLVRPRLSVAGSTVNVYVGGFRPGEDVPLHVYRGDQLVDYRATVTVRADANGEAHLALRTSRDTPPGIYLIVNPEIADTLTAAGSIPPGLEFQIDPPPVF